MRFFFLPAIFLIFQLHSNQNYLDAGVDIAKGNSLIEKINPLVSTTARQGSDASFGGFGGIFDLSVCNYKNPLLVCTCDGVGTKLKIANSLDIHDTIGIDLVAMSINDLLAQGAVPLLFLDIFPPLL